MIRRVAAALVCAIVLVGAVHRPSKSVGKRVLPIALVLNGTRLAVNPSPVFYQNHLLVPVRRILSALGLSFEKEGRSVRTYAGAKTITLLIGHSYALVDNQPVQLDASPVEIKNVLYAPLKFFAQALDAQALFDRQTDSVEIVSTLVGRSGNGIVSAGGGVQEMGTITAIDLNSSPPTLTLTHNASVRTLQILSDAAVIVQDVNTGTSNAGALEDVHVGDYAQLRLNESGIVKQIVDAYGSRSGQVAAVAPGQLVLDDGRVIGPSRATTVTVNGAIASIDQIEVGDEVMVRYNIDSSEAREIIATRKASGLPPPAVAGAAITSIEAVPNRPLRAGDVLSVTLRGTPGARVAHYDIGPYVRNLGLQETLPGIYTGTYTIPRGVNFADAPVFGHLDAGGTELPVMESASTVSVATDPPGIVDFAPDTGGSVNNSRPSIYATFESGTVGVNTSSEKIVVNGHDVTSSATRTARFIHYTPGVDYPPGPMHVAVSVADAAGNIATKSWTFFIKR